MSLKFENIEIEQGRHEQYPGINQISIHPNLLIQSSTM